VPWLLLLILKQADAAAAGRNMQPKLKSFMSLKNNTSIGYYSSIARGER